MRLDKIKLAGFKSFVDPTTVDFPSSLTGIVGPNGCGKSNIIDAIRWVMGESSAKNLRGESIADVIFNGTTSRKPVGQASIELVFDNREGKLGGEYAKYSEIAIKRQVNRDAQSTYFLNNTRCRRRDITDVFLGTGLGPRSYSIIEQGMISRLIEAKPEDLRSHLEEASGISKYKERRRETENRIRHTKENLDRLSDLREELGKQLEHLKRQSAAAERYKVLKEEERLLRAQTQACRFQSLEEQMQKTHLILEEGETRLAAEVAEQQHIDTEMVEKREQEHELTDAHQKIQTEYYECGSAVSRLEQEMNHHKERHQQLRQDLTQAEDSWSELKKHAQDDQEKLEELKKEIKEIEPILKVKRETSEMAQTRLSTAEIHMQDWQTSWDQFNEQAAKASETAQVEQTRIQQIEQRQTAMRKRLEAISAEQKQLDTKTLEGELARFREEFQTTDERVSRDQIDVTQMLEAISEKRHEEQTLQHELNEIRGELQAQKGRQASLQALQQEVLGKKSLQTTEWLERKGLNQAPRVAETLDVEKGWEKAVEVVLGRYLEAVCVDDITQLATELSDLSEGDLTLVQQSSSAHLGQDPHYLSQKITGNVTMQAMLNRIRVADNMEQAIGQLAQLQEGESIICPDGTWLSQHWLRINRDNDVHSGTLRREQELRDLQAAIEKMSVVLEEKETLLEETRQSLLAVEKKREEDQHALNQLKAQLADVRAQVSMRQSRIEQLKQRFVRLEAEAKEINAQLVSANNELTQARTLWQEAMASMEENANLREDLLAQRDICRAELETAQKESREHRDTMHQVELRWQNLETQIKNLEENLMRMRQQESHLSSRCNQLQLALSEGDTPLDEMREQLETTLKQRVEVEQKLVTAKQALDECQHRLRELETKRHSVEEQIEKIRQSLEEKRLQFQEAKVRCNTLKEQLTESGFTLEEIINALPESVNESELTQMLEQTLQRIQRLGAINLAAIDEYQAQSERKEYLDAQNADLEEALNTLENAIRKIDKETRERFKQTFDTVNTYFQEYFPRVFGGGSACLELTGEDLLDTGVTVMARPPGKKNSTIHLLSGGEKALTAIALVFSFFQLNPAPFCLLDEVDAPLDDTNVGRFCQLVKEMSEKVQFIFISHNKLAIEMAKHLTGVTMHEPGVSRIVSVNMDEAMTMVEA